MDAKDFSLDFLIINERKWIVYSTVLSATVWLSWGPPPPAQLLLGVLASLLGTNMVLLMCG